MREERLRAAYAEHMRALWAQADAATNGWMVSAEGAARGITGADLYDTGRTRAAWRYASEELRHAVDKRLCQPPVTYTDFARGQRVPRERVARWLDTRAVADLCGLEPQTVRAHRTRGTMPDPTMIVGGSPVWSRDVIERWQANRRRWHRVNVWTGVAS